MIRSPFEACHSRTYFLMTFKLELLPTWFPHFSWIENLNSKIFIVFCMSFSGNNIQSRILDLGTQQIQEVKVLSR